jgi:hypothetical protein
MVMAVGPLVLDGTVFTFDVVYVGNPPLLRWLHLESAEVNQVGLGLTDHRLPGGRCWAENFLSSGRSSDYRASCCS